MSSNAYRVPNTSIEHNLPIYLQPEIAVTYEYELTEKPVYDKVKRVFDIIIATGSLVLLFPLMLVVSFAIMLDDPKGSPIYTQTRVGKNGKTFKFYKFRSMCVDADQKLPALRLYNEVDGPVFKMKTDPRVTKVGRIIRKTSLDELPQLWNVIKGDISIVGPRSPLPSEVAKYSEYELHRLDVIGGLTCFWQVNGRSNLSFKEWIEMDLDYIEKRSIWVDLAIIVKTFRAVVCMIGAS